MPPKHHVFVFNEGQDVLVRPGTVITGKGNNTKVKLRNFTQQTLLVDVPAGVGGVAQSLIVPPGGSDDINVDNNATDAVYEYSVFALTNPPVAGKGGSSPKIIIDG